MEDIVQQRLRLIGYDFSACDYSGVEFLFNRKTADFINSIISRHTSFATTSNFLKNYDDSDEKQKENYEEILALHTESKKFF